MKSSRMNNPFINCDENGKQIAGIKYFSNICLKYLNDNCYSIDCKFLHSLPNETIIAHNLGTLSSIELIDLYNNLPRIYHKLFHEYFLVICKIFGKLKQRTQLLLMIDDCFDESFKIDEQQEYLKYILNGFLASGMTYGTSIDFIIKKLEKKLTNFSYQYILLNIIINENNNKLMIHLEKFTNSFKIEQQMCSKLIQKLISITLSIETDYLLSFTLKILRNCSINLIRQLKRDDLTLFLKYCQIHGIQDTNVVYSKMI